MNKFSASDDAWNTGPPLDVLLRSEPYRFEFFQAVRILERLFRHAIGTDADPEDEVVRFRAHQTLTFPPSAIHNIVADRDTRLSMTVAFMGLTGPSGALPRHYTELVMDRLRQKDRTLRDFLDLFNHRLIALFYRAWQKNRFWVGYECADMMRERYRDDASQYRAFITEIRPREDLFSQCLLDLSGMGPAPLRYRATVRTELRPRTSVADLTVRFYAGLLAQQHRSAIGLEGILRDFFGVRMQVIQFVGQWLLLEDANQTQLVDGGNTQLAVTAIAGQRFWDVQGKFRIRVGPLTYAQFQDFLPSGTAYCELGDLARLYAGLAMDIDAQLVLQAEEVPWCQLSAAAGPRLGWNTWVRCGELVRDADDAILRLEGSQVENVEL
ncbi:MAG: type VI secretion system baseplate subunit TssG [Pirellulaceae bacterium]